MDCVRSTRLLSDGKWAQLQVARGATQSADVTGAVGERSIAQPPHSDTPSFGVPRVQTCRVVQGQIQGNLNHPDCGTTSPSLPLWSWASPGRGASLSWAHLRRSAAAAMARRCRRQSRHWSAATRRDAAQRSQRRSDPPAQHQDYMIANHRVAAEMTGRSAICASMSVKIGHHEGNTPIVRRPRSLFRTAAVARQVPPSFAR